MDPGFFSEVFARKRRSIPEPLRIRSRVEVYNGKKEAE